MSPTSSGVITATGELFPGLQPSGGVAMNPPPAAMLGAVSKMVTEAMANIPDDERGQLIGIATRAADGSVNVNLALAQRVNGHVDIIAFAGKSWGTPLAAAPLSAGAAGRVHW